MKIGIFSKPHFLSRAILVFALVACFIYGYIAYFTIRTEFFKFILLSGIAFITTYVLIEKSQLKFNQLFLLAIFYRLIFLLSLPNLSQDFFRFFWDGQLVLQGINPYLETVNYYFSQNLDYKIQQADILRKGMGDLNASHYSNYPPMSQFIYAISAWFANDSIYGFIIAIRLILISFDLLFVLFAKKILAFFNKDPKALFWYILNPLCIIEITGNLHLEGVMIALFVVAFFFMLRQRYIHSAFLFSLSITTKLMSLIFVPVLLKYFYKNNRFSLNFKTILNYGFWLVLFLFIQFALFYNSTFYQNFSQTISLWFGKFEFNASIYYVVRWIGYKTIGWNIIQTYSQIMPLFSILCFIIILYKRKASPDQLLESFMWMLTIYYLLSTTIHPWYILFPLALSVFTRYNFVYLWSFLTLLSYYSYKISEVKESYWILILEYGLIIIYMFYELRKPLNKHPKHNRFIT